jgi:hypothetical protein
MPDLFGEAFWPGAESYLECQYTCSWGITPGTAVFTMGPQLRQVAEVGDLVITDGSGRLVLKDCKVVKPSGQADGSGQRVTLLIEDRRWKWRTGTLSGRYNVLDERTSTIPPVARPLAPAENLPGPPPAPAPNEEPIRPWSKKTAQELAQLCLEAMGEQRYDVSALDPVATPSVNWDATNPAQALSTLVEDLGCVVVYRPDTDNVLIAKRGEGEELPGGLFLADHPSFDVKARPPKIVCLGAYKQYQVSWQLEAVGLDFDGAIRPLDELSYRPHDDAWNYCLPPGFAGLWHAQTIARLPAGYGAQDALALARGSVFRMYRIVITDEYGDPLEIGADQDKVRIERLEQVRLLAYQNKLVTDDTGRLAAAPARCYGQHVAPEAFKIGQDIQAAWQETDDLSPVHVPFTIDAAHQLVTFAKFIYGKESNLIVPAVLTLETAAEITDPKTMQFIRYQRERVLSGGLDTQPHYFVADDVVYKVTELYDVNGEFSGHETNAKDVERRADYYIAGEARRFEPASAGDRTYPGILPIFPDGAIQQVTWAVGGGREDNPQTHASRNSEHAHYLPTFEGRRRNELANLDQQRRDYDATEAARESAADVLKAGLHPAFVANAGIGGSA